MTKNTANERFPQNVLLPANQPLPDAGVVLCGQVRTVAKERLGHCRDELSNSQMREVERALATVLVLPKPERLN